MDIICQPIKTDSDQLFKLSITFKDIDYTSVSLSFGEIDEVIATTEGTIVEKEVFLNDKKRRIDIFVKPIHKTLDVNISYLHGESVIYHDKHEIELQLARKDRECKPLTVFTGNKRFDVFEEKIKSRLLPDWDVNINEHKEEVSITIKNNKIATLVCFGILSTTVTAKDISFVLDPDIELVVLPWDLLLYHFAGQETALHILVKPDFQKKIDNIYYKSQISDSIKIPDKKISMRRLHDFMSPVGPLNASQWIVNYENQFPEYVDK